MLRQKTQTKIKKWSVLIIILTEKSWIHSHLNSQVYLVKGVVCQLRTSNRRNRLLCRPGVFHFLNVNVKQVVAAFFVQALILLWWLFYYYGLNRVILNISFVRQSWDCRLHRIDVWYWWQRRLWLKRKINLQVFNLRIQINLVRIRLVLYFLG